MAAPNKLQKLFQNFKGLDLRSSDLLREAGSATIAKNSNVRLNGGLDKRKGFQISGAAGGGWGGSSFNNVNTATGAITEELLSVSDDLYRLEAASFTVTYTGSDSAYYDMLLSVTDNKFYFTVYDNFISVLAYDLGTGKESTPVNVTTLVAAINGLTNFTCTGSSSTSAAFIPVTLNSSIATGGTAISFKNWAAVPTAVGVTTPFSTFYAARNNADFENASFSQLRDILFIATGHDNLQKYDGSRVYRAGMPKGYQSLAEDAAGTTFAQNVVFKYIAIYEYKDAKENIISSEYSDFDTVTIAAASADVDLTIENLQATGFASDTTATGFNIAQAAVNGNQTASNILVTSSSEIKVNDYLYVSNGGTVESVKVTAIPDSTHVTLEKSVTVVNAEIMATVKISVNRTGDGGITYYLLVDLINDSGNATQAYKDQIVDATLTASADFTVPIKPHNLPPKCKHLADWRGQLIMTGNLTEPNKAYYSDIDSPEYFPSTDNNFIVHDKVTGVKHLDNLLYIFHNKSFTGVTGDLATDSFVVDVMSADGIGAESHSSIIEAQGKLFFTSKKGIYSVNQEQGLKEASVTISPTIELETSFDFSRAVSFNWADERKLLFFIPVLSDQGGEKYTNVSDSRTYMYDTYWNSWMEWVNVDMIGGVSLFEDKVYMCDRKYDTATSAMRQDMRVVLNNGNTFDYADHEDSISMEYGTHWEDFKEPSLLKKFLRLKIHSVDTALSDFESDQFTLVVDAQYNYETIALSSMTFDFSGGSVGWGEGEWDTAPWGDTRLYHLKKKMASRKARSLRLIFKNDTVHENVLISGYTLDVVLPYALQMKE